MQMRRHSPKRVLGDLLSARDAAGFWHVAPAGCFHPICPPMNDSTSLDLPVRSAIDAERFRGVMGNFVTGVTVVTAREGEGVRGMTANAFMSGSLEPPLCVISVAKRAHMHALLMSGEHFGVSILAAHQEDIADHFSGRPNAKLSVRFGAAGPVSLVAETCGRLAATIAGRHDCGDHTIFIGRIFYLESEDRPPLVYHAGGYAALDRQRPEHDVAVPEFW
jgi:flavin reductase